MKVFSLKTQLHKFKEFSEFTEEFEVGIGDLILASKSTYNNYLKHLDLKTDFLFSGDYGIGEPSDEMIDKILKDIKNKVYIRIIAVGGGTVLDIAKILVLKNVKKSRDVFEKKKKFVKDKELILIPTTCGTGSEVTFYSVAEIKGTSSKIGVGIEEFYADHAVMIPELLNKLPYNFFVFSSLDALIHASESFVSPKSNGYTELFSAKAIEMILKGYIDIAEKGEEARFDNMENFLIASNYAGIAFGNTGVGAVHALSYPLGGKYHVPHGEANYEFFMEVFKLYSNISPKGKIKEFAILVAALLKIEVNLESDESGYFLVFDHLERLLNKIWKRKPAREFGMLEKEIKIFAESVFEKQQRLLSNNYAPFNSFYIEDIYKNIY